VRCAAGSILGLRERSRGAHREEEEIGGDNREQKGLRLLPRGAEHHPTCPTTLYQARTIRYSSTPSALLAPRVSGPPTATRSPRQCIPTGKWSNLPTCSAVHGHVSPVRSGGGTRIGPASAFIARRGPRRQEDPAREIRAGQPAGVAVSEDRRLPCPRGLRPDWMDGEDRAGRKEGTAGSGSSQARRVGRGVAVPTSL
jgi:hypothetical protein